MQFKSSSLVLILANLIPLIGVALFDWRVFDIMILYWTESVIIGVINVLRMISCRSGNIFQGMLPTDAGDEVAHVIGKTIPRRIISGIKLFMVPFFVLHYGAFCMGHLMAVQSLFGETAATVSNAYSIQYFWQFEYWLAVIAIFGSHLFSYFTNFMGKGEYLRTSVVAMMQRPYGRIIVMQVAIIGGAFLMEFLGSPVWMLIVLIIMKTSIDLRLHQSERRKLGTAPIS